MIDISLYIFFFVDIDEQEDCDSNTPFSVHPLLVNEQQGNLLFQNHDNKDCLSYYQKKIIYTINVVLLD